MAQKLKYRSKYAENGGHFEIQDGHHRDILESGNNMICVHGVLLQFKPKKYTISKVSNFPRAVIPFLGGSLAS